MIKLLSKLFIKDHNNINDPNVRGKYGTLASIVGERSDALGSRQRTLYSIPVLEHNLPFLTLISSRSASGFMKSKSYPSGMSGNE